ncbi:MAG: type II toxin-antitoxin system RelE/ParE family toxin [Pirellulales bacterium]
MARQLRFHETARDDVARAYVWYEERSGGLGLRFLAAVDDAVEILIRRPDAWPLAFDDVRRVLLDHFPYGVFYELTPDEVIVLGVLHHAQDQTKWRERLKP